MRVEINSLAEVVEVACDFHRQIATPPWWRGHADATCTLVPSVHRTDRSHGAERSMLGMFITRSKSRRTDLPTHDDFGGWLILARHHGLPTRLLDWTENILIALYFAVMPPDERAGTLWALNPNRLNRHQTGRSGVYLPNVPQIADIFRRAFSGEKPPEPKVAAIVPHEVDLKVLLQQSRFTVHDAGTPLESVVADEQILCRFTIPSASKVRMATELEALGFRRSILFPDLTTLADEIADLRFRDE